jgi:hypothetical protein
VIEIIARTEHLLDEPAARVVVAGRVRDFEPRKGEDAEAYRRRVEPLTKDATIYEAHRRQFDSFVSRVADAMRASMPEARLDIREAEAQVKRPSRRPSAPPPPPTDTRYDPYDVYYPNPFSTMLSVMMWSSIFSMAMPPHVIVVNDHGDHLGAPTDPHIQETAADPMSADDGMSHADDTGNDQDMSTDADGGDMGGDFGDGDFGGGDFGGGDFGGDW